MAIKTDSLTHRLVVEFKDGFTNRNDVYLFGSDHDGSVIYANTDYAKRNILESAIFGVKVKEPEFAVMITARFWTPDVIYQMYDDRKDLTETNFFVIIEPEDSAGDYHIFKCLFNNNGSPSTAKPLYDINVVDTGGELNVADGYIWRYMCTVPHSIANKFRTRDHFPIVANASVASAAVEGIHTILVENFQENFGYKRISGSVESVPDQNGFLTLNITETENNSFEEAFGIYIGQALYVVKEDTSEVIGAKQYIISGSGKTSNGVPYVTILNYGQDTFTINRFDRIYILPRIEVTGAGVGAEAIAVFDSTGARIHSIQMIRKGTGYLSASAKVIDPINFNENAGDVKAKLRPIISPRGGHGSDVYKELRTTSFCISRTITDFATVVPGSGTYSKIALVTNPIITGIPDSFDNRLKITLIGSADLIPVGSIVTQRNGARGIVHEIKNNDIYLVNYLQETGIQFVPELSISSGVNDINITTITKSLYTPRSGDVLLITNFSPVERLSSKRESIKILIDF